MMVKGQNTDLTGDVEMITVQPSLCMDDFLAVDFDKIRSGDHNEEMKNLGITMDASEMTKCYEYLENFRSKIHGFNIYSQCYVDEEFLHVEKGDHRINRCGQWLQLVGPSQKQVICMIAGSHKIKSDQFEGVPIIALPTSMFEGLSPGMTSATGMVTPITVAETDFDLRINPTLYVTYTTKGTNFLHFVNMNRPSEKLSMEGMEYRMGEDNRFNITYKEGRNITISLISFDNERIDFPNVDLGNYTDYIESNYSEEKDNMTFTRSFPTHSRFVNYAMSKCHYLTENHIYNKGAYKRNKFMKWTIFKTDIDDSKKATSEKVYYSNQRQNFTIDVTSPRFNLTFSLSPSATVFSSAFKYFEIIMKPNFEMTNYKHINSTVTAQEGANTIQTLITIANNENLPTKYYYDQEAGLIYVKVAFRRNNKLFVDELTIESQVENWSEDVKNLWSLEVQSATLIRKDEYTSQPSCSSQAFQCHKTECTIAPDVFVPGVSPWESVDCIGSCGSCSVGYSCNATGRCVKDVSINTRSATSGMYILTFFAFILFFL